MSHENIQDKVFQAEETASAKAQRQEQAWCVGRTAETRVATAQGKWERKSGDEVRERKMTSTAP